MTTSLAIAATSDLAARAGAEIAELGGNAVDAALAATLVSINTEPGVCSLACGGFITICAPGQAPVTLDGYVAVPGKGISADTTRVSTPVTLEYGGGITTVVGPDSIGVPGGIALFATASERFGSAPWASLFNPAIRAVREGFPLPDASYHYLTYSGDSIFGRSTDGHTALHNADGSLRKPGEKIFVPHLADSLEQIAAGGATEFYTGDIGAAMSRYVIDSGGRLSHEDLATYQTLSRPALGINSSAADHGWKIATNPPPAVGGTVLAAMLQLMSNRPGKRQDADSLRYLIEVQRQVLGYRQTHLDLSDDIDNAAKHLLDLTAAGSRTVLESGSTCHTSAVDASGLACAVTVSAGYGAGDMPPGTGIWLNNCIGELELNKRGMDIGPPGARLPSNMAPSVAVHPDGSVLAIGSPGADRITTATLQTLVNHFYLGMSLRDAVDHPRCHVELTDAGFRVAYEAGLDVEALGLPSRQYAQPSMYFGGVGAAVWSPGAGFTVAADPRRAGGTWVHGGGS